MKSGNYFYITALPMLGDLGSSPPITSGELLEYLLDAPSLHRCVESLFLLDDLQQREAYLSGELKQVQPTVLTEGQVHNEESLPDYVAFGMEETSRTIKVDALWENYFRYAVSVAEEEDSEFLSEWTRFEVTLRNSLVSERARRLGLEENDYLVAPELIVPGDEFSGLINEWASAQTPLAGYRILTSARWDWLVEHEGWFRFNNDEVIAYAAKVMLLGRWYRLIEAGEATKETERTEKK